MPSLDLDFGAGAAPALLPARPPSPSASPALSLPSPCRVGCGKHIDSALAGVPEEERCHCKAWTQAQHDAEQGGASCSLQ